MNATGYQIFLMVELARLVGLIEQQLEYDTSWEMGEKLYSEFEKSKYNDSFEPEYECIENFLNNYGNEQFEAFLTICEKVGDNPSEKYTKIQSSKGLFSLKLNGVNYWVDGNFFTITEDEKLILNIGDGKTKIFTEW